MNDSWEPTDFEEFDEPQAPVHRRRTRGGQGNWYLLTGLIIGLGLGLLYAWVISPVKYTDTAPSVLSVSAKDEYRRVIALAYQSDHNIGRARERLKLLGPENPIQALAAQAQKMIAENQSAGEARALALLAADLGKPAGALIQSTPMVVAAAGQTVTPEPSPFATLEAGQAIATPTVPIPTATLPPTTTPLPTFTPRPTATMLPTLSAPFMLKSKESTCGGTVRPGMLEIQVNGSDDQPLPGVRILVTWKDGESTFYTGLIPEKNPGFADFEMKPGLIYTLQVGEVSEAVKDIKIPDCNGSLLIKFKEE